MGCNFGSDKCKEKIENCLKDSPGVNIVSIDVPTQRVILNITSNCSMTIMDIQSRIENEAGIKTIVRGVGDQFTGVAEIFGPSNLVGVVRLAQILDNKCYIDGTVDNIHLAHNNHNCMLNIHEYGDLQGENFSHVGPTFIEVMKNVPPKQNRCQFKGYVNDCHLPSIIGRSLVITEQELNKHLGAGIIARSSSIFGNVKKICECSGKTLWDERTEKKNDLS